MEPNDQNIASMQTVKNEDEDRPEPNEAFLALLHFNERQNILVKYCSIEDVKLVKKSSDSLSDPDNPVKMEVDGQKVFLIQPIGVDFNFGPYRGKLLEEYISSFMSCTSFAICVISHTGPPVVYGSIDDRYKWAEWAKEGGSSELTLRKGDNCIFRRLHEIELPVIELAKFKSEFQAVVGLVLKRKLPHHLRSERNTSALNSADDISLAPVGAEEAEEIISALSSNQAVLANDTEPINPENEQFLLLEVSPDTYRFMCDWCCQIFDDPRSLARHMKVHIDSTKTVYVCPMCDKHFNEKHNLQSHILVHTGEKPYVCKICSRPFRHKHHLVGHVRSVHTGEKPYSCTYCDKKFARWSQWSAHERVHTGEKNHECQYCQKKFSRSDHMKKHELTHTGVKPFVCKLCGQGFRRSDHLKRHHEAHANVGEDGKRKRRRRNKTEAGKNTSTSSRNSDSDSNFDYDAEPPTEQRKSTRKRTKTQRYAFSSESDSEFEVS